MKKYIIISLFIVLIIVSVIKNKITFNYYIETENKLQEVSETISVSWLERIKFPQVELKHYDILGWTEGDSANFAREAKNRRNLIYKMIITPKVYKINFYKSIDDNEPYYVQNHVYGEETKISYTLPDTETHQFTSWVDPAQYKVNYIAPTYDSNIDLYPLFSPKEFSINYHLNGGNLSSAPDTYTYGTETILPIPSRANYTFEGWYLDETFTTPISLISSTLHTDLNLYAKWKFIYTEGDYGRLTIGPYTAKLCSARDVHYKGMSAQAICDLPDVCFYTTRRNNTVIIFADHNTQGFLAIKNYTSATWTHNGITTHLQRVSIYTGDNEGLNYDDGTCAYDNPDGPILMYTCIPNQKGKVYITFWKYI